MSPILNITSADIKALADDKLRQLIGMLCEADYRTAKLATAGIIWGGSQDAADGGLDVVVRGNIETSSFNYIPRQYTGFQVKKPAMNSAEIEKEMKPKGIVRDCIKSLIAEEGAYIIVSSGSSVTNSSLSTRKKAMQDAVAQINGHEKLYLDFYDSGRIATWVRYYPSLVLWVLMNVGRPLQGWQSYGNWASSGGTNNPYLIDEGLRLHGGAIKTEQGQTAIDAIRYLRDQLVKPKSCLRLVGLSGVGKTRFVQALFEHGIGDDHLDPSLAIYTDMSDSPSPDPVAFARGLISNKTEAILIVDNCPPDLHKRLVDVCTGIDSFIKLLTVEYDVRDDLPEETEVLRLEPASEELIFRLINCRFPHISDVDVRTISEFSGGNARVAIALASTVVQGKSLGDLRDRDLFRRLFDQTNDPSEKLLCHAEILSLVYSFNGVDTQSEKSELIVLASLTDNSVQELYRSLAEIQKRQLIQTRGDWRAVLPHAIANRLAAQALSSIPKESILNTFLAVDRNRLLSSFARRLGFLHNSPEAKMIVDEWLMPTGWLGQKGGILSDPEVLVLKNIAPVSPESVLTAIEYWEGVAELNKQPLQQNKAYSNYIYLLRHVAYEASLFLRCVKLLCRFLLAERADNLHSVTRDNLKSLFYIKLSGTHASAEDRAFVIRTLWYSGINTHQNLALELLDTALESRHFYSHYDFSFGARPRGIGWAPQNRNDVTNWYHCFIVLGLDFAQSDFPKAASVKLLLAKQFQGMWSVAHVFSELEVMCDQLLNLGSWYEGWIAVRETIRFDKADVSSDAMLRLRQIERKLKPKNLLESIHAYVLSNAQFIHELEDNEQDDESNEGHLKLQNLVKDLGQKTAEDQQLFSSILPDLITSNSVQLTNFGKGLAEGMKDKVKLWSEIRNAYNHIPKEQIQVRCLMGVLSSSSMCTLVDNILDQLVDDPLLRDFYPLFQTVVDITPIAVERLHRSLDLGNISISAYKDLIWSVFPNILTEDELALFFSKLLVKDGGLAVVSEILHRRSTKSSPFKSKALSDIGKNIFLGLPNNKKQLGRLASDFHLTQLAEKCMVGEEAQEVVKIFCQRMAEAIDRFEIYAIDYERLFANIAKLHSKIFLDIFLAPLADGSDHRRHRVFSRDSDYGINPLSKIAESDIIAWCNIAPSSRYTIIAASIPCFIPKPTSDSKSKIIPIIWNPLVYSLLENTNSISDVLDALQANLRPMSWSGSLADVMATRAEMLKELFTYGNPIVESWAQDKYKTMMHIIDEKRKGEQEDLKRQAETFE